MDKIHAMQLFIRVADLESFSRAAETLALPKGSVSRQIQALESHLGVRLLHRTTRRVQLTQDGMVYYERAKDLLSNLDELDGMFQHDPASISGRLRVDMPVGFAKKMVIPHLPTFLQQYPGIELELSSSDRLVDVAHGNTAPRPSPRSSDKNISPPRSKMRSSAGSWHMPICSAAPAAWERPLVPASSQRPSTA